MKTDEKWWKVMKTPLFITFHFLFFFKKWKMFRYNNSPKRSSFRKGKIIFQGLAQQNQFQFVNPQKTEFESLNWTLVNCILTFCKLWGHFEDFFWPKIVTLTPGVTVTIFKVTIPFSHRHGADCNLNFSQNYNLNSGPLRLQLLNFKVTNRQFFWATIAQI